MPRATRLLRDVALGAYLLLLALTVLWEGWLAPAGYVPPGFWLTIKSLPLLLPLFGLLHGRPYTYAWTGLLLLPYFVEGVVLTYEHRHDLLGAHSVLPYAASEVLLCVAFFVSGALYARMRSIQLQHDATD